MIAAIFIIIAAIAKAFADTLDSHFDTSIFRYLPRKYFDPNIIHKKAKQIFGYPIDAWHISNSLQLSCWLLLPFAYKNQFNPLIDFGIGCMWFIVVFNVFYNKIFRK